MKLRKNKHMDLFEHLGHCCGDELRKWGSVCEHDKPMHRNRSTVMTCGNGELGGLVDSPEMQRFRTASGIDAILQTASPEEAIRLLGEDSVRQSIACILIGEDGDMAPVVSFAKQLRSNGSGAIPCVAVGRRATDLRAARQSLVTRFQRRGDYFVNCGLLDSTLQIDIKDGAEFSAANPESVARAILAAVERRVDLVVPYGSI